MGVRTVCEGRGQCPGSKPWRLTAHQGLEGADSGLRTTGAADNFSSKNCFTIFKIKVHQYLFCPEARNARSQLSRRGPQSTAGATEATQKAQGPGQDLLPLLQARFSLVWGHPLAENGGHVRERTGHSRRDSRGPQKMPKMPRPVGLGGGWRSSPHAQRRERPLAHCLTGEETSMCFCIFPVLHNDYVLLLWKNTIEFIENFI